MLYQIDISHRAHQDIEDAACYIAYQLKNPSAAQNLVRRAFGSIDSLEELPARFSVVRDPFLASLSIRFVPVQVISPFIRSMKLPRPYTFFVFCTARATGLLS